MLYNIFKECYDNERKVFQKPSIIFIFTYGSTEGK